MSQKCFLCLAECMNPYTYFCPRNFSTTNRVFCRTYLCSTCVSYDKILQNGCPNCRIKGGKGKFVPPGHGDDILSARASVESIPQTSPTEVPDFSEQPPILTGKRRATKTDFFKPEQKKTAKRFPCCFLCSGNMSVRFCDASVSGFFMPKLPRAQLTLLVQR